MSSTTPKQYDIVVLGANGYTATIVTEYVAKNLPIDLSWAVAGRSQTKLEELLERLKLLDLDRQPPGEPGSAQYVNQDLDVA